MFQLVDAVVRYGSVVALDLRGADLELNGATTVGVMGPNGSGKTSLLRVLAGLQSLSAGRCLGNHGEVAYVAQHQHQHGWMPLTVREVLTTGRYRRTGLIGRLSNDDRRAITHAAARLDVSDLLRRPFNELSGGQRQRVLVATALAADASCLLLDEPITGLDLNSQQTILEVIDAERDRGRLVVMTTHHLSEARRCDRVLLLDTTLVADGPPSAVLTADNLATVFGSRLITRAADGADGGAETSQRLLVIDDHGHGVDGHDHTVGEMHR